MPQRLRDAHVYSLTRQFVLPSHKGNSIENVADTLVGIHAARLITPYFALRTRLDDLRHDSLISALENWRLLKARCMRGTLHLLTPAVFSAAHHATLTARLAVCHSMYRRIGLRPIEAAHLKQLILAVLDVQPRSTAEIEHALRDCSKQGPTRRQQLAARAVLKELWERGIVCYANASRTFGREERRYCLTPSVYLSHFSGDQKRDSTRTLVRHYLAGYAPATTHDIAWWSGISKGDIQAALRELGGEVRQVTFEDFPEPMWVLNSDLHGLQTTRSPTSDWVALLAHEDPSLKAYFSSRTRYISTSDYSKLFNAIGESRPAIMLNGRVVGVWTLDKKTAQVSRVLFQTLSRRRERLIDAAVTTLQNEATTLLHP